MTDSTAQFGKYRILGELGRGGFATVFRAMDTTLEREVALKILHPQLLADSTFVQRFRQEARTLAALRHPQIITVYEVGEAEGRLFIAMDLAHGPSLAQSIARRGRIPWSEALELLKTVCTALDYAHGQRVVHRDLKPANVLLDKQRGALLTDFGFARLMGESSVSLSMSGGVAGTPGYIAPEVWEQNAADAPADIYALGCIAYEMLTGEVLFKGQTPMQVMRAHDHGPAFPEAWQDDVPPGMAAVLGKALAHDPAARYSNAMALWHALNDLEAAARAAREAQAQAALIGQWRSEAEAALAAGELNAARMAIGRWLALAPDDVAAQAARARLERMSAPAPKAETVPPPKAESAPPPRAESAPRPTPVSQVSKQPPPQRAPTADSRAGTGTTPPRKGLSTLTMAVGGFVAVIILLIGIVALIQGGPGGGATPAAQPAAQPTATAPPTRAVTATRAPTAAPAAITAPEATTAPAPTAAPAATPAPARTTTPTPAPAATPAPTATPAPAPATASGAGKGQIVFSSDRDEPRGELYLINIDGSGLTRLTNSSGSDDSPVWSPDGSRIAFVSDHDGDTEIYVMNADGSGRVQLTDNTTRDDDPAWSPDGKRIVFASDRDRPLSTFDIYVMNADGSGQTRLTDDSATEGCPHWSPDGKYIAFGRFREGGSATYLMNADGSKQRLLADNVDCRVWSPDRTQIAFTADVITGNADIFVMNADGSNQIDLTNNPAFDSGPTWSPDGQRIAFYTDRDGNWEIYVMNADGSEQTNVTNSPAGDSRPAWRPRP